MPTASNLIVLLDLVEAGIVLNDKLTNYFRTKELAGEEVTVEDLNALAAESDDAFNRFKDLYT